MLEHKFKKDNLTIVLNNPNTNNAFSLQVAEEIVALVYKHQPKSILFSARGRVFSSGGQLKDYAKLTSKEEGLAINQKIRTSLDYLYHLPIPKAVIVDGFCFGGGVEFVSCFDWVVCSPRTYFGLWQRKIGLSFGWGGKARLEARLGAHALKTWYISGDLYPSYKAKTLGLVDHIAPRSRAVEAAKNWLARGRKLSDHALEVSATQGLNEVQVFETLWLSEDHRKALEAFKS